MPSLTLVLPAYNEEARLPRTFELLKSAIQQGEFNDVQLEQILVVNDGSSDQTLAVSQNQEASMPILKTLNVTPNSGKGNAVHVGLKAATTDWVLVADADSATPWNQFRKLFQTQAPVAIGSRALPESDVRTHQSFLRENMGRTFNLFVRAITGLNIKDTQCGFKLFHRKSVSPFLGQLQVKRFAWDVELLLFARAHQLKIQEVPVTWEHQDDSSVRKFADSFEMLLRLIQMRLRVWWVTRS